MNILQEGGEIPKHDDFITPYWLRTHGYEKVEDLMYGGRKLGELFENSATRTLIGVSNSLEVTSIEEYGLFKSGDSFSDEELRDWVARKKLICTDKICDEKDKEKVYCYIYVDNTSCCPNDETQYYWFHSIENTLGEKIHHISRSYRVPCLTEIIRINLPEITEPATVLI